MAITVTALDAHHEALAAWVGRPVEEVTAELADAPDGMAHWVAWDGTAVVGAIHPWRRPDGRLHVYHDGCRADAVAPLFEVVTEACSTEVDLADEALLGALERCGFAASRREHLIEVPVAPVSAPRPAGVSSVPADQCDPVALMYLDAELRNDTPGAEGWQPDLAWFVSETFESPYFDPETYPVAVTDGRLLGLARVWSGPVPNRLGHVGVRREHRRRGIALWLVGSIFEVLQRRGTASVTAEVDDGNVASLALFRHLGAVTTGGRIELARAALR